MSLLKQVVTRNYKDLKSEFSWLIRAENENIDKTVAFKVVKATGVTFEGSNESEKGFGCSVVAFCEKAEVFNEPFKDLDTSNLTKLKFDLYEFLDPRSNIVDKVDTLYLDEEGHMWAEGCTTRS